jgi:hypothetical protein
MLRGHDPGYIQDRHQFKEIFVLSHIASQRIVERTYPNLRLVSSPQAQVTIRVVALRR